MNITEVKQGFAELFDYFSDYSTDPDLNENPLTISKDELRAALESGLLSKPTQQLVRTIFTKDNIYDLANLNDIDSGLTLNDLLIAESGENYSSPDESADYQSWIREMALDVELYLSNPEAEKLDFPYATTKEDIAAGKSLKRIADSLIEKKIIYPSEIASVGVCTQTTAMKRIKNSESEAGTFEVLDLLDVLHNADAMTTNYFDWETGEKNKESRIVTNDRITRYLNNPSCQKDMEVVLHHEFIHARKVETFRTLTIALRDIIMRGLQLDADKVEVAFQVAKDVAISVHELETHMNDFELLKNLGIRDESCPYDFSHRARIAIATYWGNIELHLSSFQKTATEAGVGNQAKKVIEQMRELIHKQIQSSFSKLSPESRSAINKALTDFEYPPIQM